MLRASDSTAKALALAISGAAIVVSFPNAAAAFTQRQCSVIASAFEDYVRANVRNFSADDGTELRKFTAWVRGGCQGNITLQNRPEVAAAMAGVQTQLASSTQAEFRVRLGDQVTLGPTVTGAVVAPTVPVSIRNTQPAPAAQRAPGG